MIISSCNHYLISGQENKIKSNNCKEVKDYGKNKNLFNTWLYLL